MESLKLTLVTPFKKVFEGVEVTEVKIPLEKGQITVYPDHSPLVATLDVGILSYTEKGKSEPVKIVISWGYCEVIDKEVKLLAEMVATKADIKLEAAQTKKKQVEEKLATNKADPKEIIKLQKELKRADAEISLMI